MIHDDSGRGMRRVGMQVLRGLSALVLTGLVGIAAMGSSRPIVRQEPFVRRAWPDSVAGRWTGRGLAYGMHRDGQRPGGPSPSRAQIAEDLAILAPHWATLRVYGSTEPTGTVLQVMRASHPDVGLVLGVWIEPETVRDSVKHAFVTDPAKVRENRRQIDEAVRLARRDADLVRAIVVGNETQVFWSGHKVPPEQLIAAIRELRARTRLPVTTADDFNFWNKPESEVIARECDFAMVHAHPLWNGQSPETAIAWTEAQLAEIRARHPGLPLVLGETGWATQRTDTGDEAKYMKSPSSDAAQVEFMRAYEAWIATRPLPVFVFEAFDENWKGGDKPDEVEKHWGLYRADRSPKPAVAGAR
ncbi:MAG: hypothetical protein RL760_857 [Candidatus Eisenbacteria bacterium]